jgi:hypothetical protein
VNKINLLDLNINKFYFGIGEETKESVGEGVRDSIFVILRSFPRNP